MAAFNLDELSWMSGNYVETDSGCWEWQRARSKHGYGQRWDRVNRKVLYVHRDVATAAHGAPEPGAFALHSCDNPPCCNPAHIRWGTRKDNAADAVARNRISRRGGAHGSDHWATRFAPRDIVAIRERREAGETLRSIALDTGASVAAISKICRRETWREVA